MPWVVLVALLMAACGATPREPGLPAHTARRAEDLRWLEGRWQTAGEGATGEVWEWADGQLHGTGYILPPADCAASQGEGGCPPGYVETEKLSILERGGALLYVASPIRQARTEFTITTLGADHFVAENPAHDFPTRIEYHHVGDGLRVVVSGPDRRFEVAFRRQ